MNESRHIKKESILKALESSLGVVTVACKKADIPKHILQMVKGR